MSAIWHAIEAAFHWVYAHLAQVGISAVVTTIGGAIMWLLGFRKAKLNNQKLALEIEHIKVDTQKLTLEVQQLGEDREQRNAAKRIESLADHIRDFVREKKIGDAIGITEIELSEQLGEPPEAINKALLLLQRHYGNSVRYDPAFQSWILDL